MIASLQGKLELLSGDWAIINVSGIGFQVYLPTSTLSNLGAVGREVKLHTHFQLREDSATLYGFASPEELGLFQTLISVTGLGPKLALAMLSAMNAEQLTLAIATDNADLLTQISGVGKKLASRIVLELREKLGAGLVGIPAQVAQENTEVLAALTSLGYSAAEASRAIASLPQEEALSLEEKVKLALQYFTAR